MGQFKNKKIAAIHFVCTGNIYRSRLAEAYIRSIAPNILVSSSGTKASSQHKGPNSWYAQRILLRNNLIPYMKNMWRDTSKNDLKNADLVIFFGQKNYDFCREKFNFNSDHLIWEISDFDDKELNGKQTNISKEIKYLKMSDDAYAQIKEKVDELIKDRSLA